MKYILTGSCGLIGRKLKEKLKKENHDCILEVDPLMGGDVLNLNSRYINPNTQKVDMFIHCAAFCKINDSIKNPKLAHFNNSEGTFQALEFCRQNNIKKFVYFSSSRVLYEQKTIYTASKLYGEELCKAYQKCYGIDYVIIRPSTVYSSNHHDFTERLISKHVINAMTDKPLIIYGTKDKTLDFTHVSDFVDGILLIINQWDKSKNEDYNISGDNETKVIDVINIVSDILEKKVEIDYQPQEMEQPQKVHVDISKMRKLGYNPKKELKEGVKEMIEFYKGEGKKWLN